MWDIITAFIAVLHHKALLSPPLLCIIARYLLNFFKDVPDVGRFSILHHWMSPQSLLHTHILSLCVVRGGISGASLLAHSLGTKWLDEGDYAKLGKELRRGQHDRSLAEAREKRRESLQCRPRVNGNNSGIFAHISHIFFWIRATCHISVHVISS